VVLTIHLAIHLVVVVVEKPTLLMTHSVVVEMVAEMVVRKRTTIHLVVEPRTIHSGIDPVSKS
jgi:hypothetical protein